MYELASGAVSAEPEGQYSPCEMLIAMGAFDRGIGRLLTMQVKIESGIERVAVKSSALIALNHVILPSCPAYLRLVEIQTFHGEPVRSVATVGHDSPLF